VFATRAWAFAERLNGVVPRVPIQEAIKTEGIGRTAIYRLIRLGLLKKYRTLLDRRTYIDLDELRELRRNPPMHEVD